MKAICYARLSIQNEDRTSITRQVAQCSAEAVRRGLIPEVFVEPDGHRSGRTEKTRPEFRRAREAIREHPGTYSQYIVADISRAARNTRNLLDFLQFLEDQHVLFVSLAEPHLSSGTMPESARKYITTLTSAGAQAYADFISDKMRGHVKYVIDAGGLWGDPPCGLRAVGKGAARHYEASDETYTVGGETRTYLETVEAMLTFYVGSEVGGYTLAKQMTSYRWRGHTGQSVPVNPSNFYHFKNIAKYYRGILDDDLLNRYEEKRARRAGRRENGRALCRPPPLLWGLVFCPLCGGRFVIKHSDNIHSEWTYYRHTHYRNCKNYHYIPAAQLDERVLAYLSEFLDLSAEKKEALIARASQPRPDKSVAKREKIESKLANLKVALVDGNVSRDEYKLWKARLDKELAELPSPAATVPVSRAEMMRRLAHPVRAIRLLGAVEQNQAMRSLFRRILVLRSGAVTYEMQDWCAAMFR